MNLDLLVSDLERDEGFRPYVYDDKVPGAPPFKRGDTLKGNLTAGIGWNLMTGILRAQALNMARDQAKDKWSDFLTLAPWVNQLSEPRQRALANMAFNLGATGLSRFTDFLALMKTGQFDQAADDLKKAPWFNEVGERGPRIEQLIRQG